MLRYCLVENPFHDCDIHFGLIFRNAHNGLDLICLNPHFLARCLNSADVYQSPLSDRTSQGIPCLLKIITVDNFMYSGVAFSKNLDIYSITKT